MSSVFESMQSTESERFRSVKRGDTRRKLLARGAEREELWFKGQENFRQGVLNDEGLLCEGPLCDREVRLLSFACFFGATAGRLPGFASTRLRLTVGSDFRLSVNKHRTQGCSHKKIWGTDWGD